MSILTTAYRAPAELLRMSLQSSLDQTLSDLVVVLVIDGDLAPDADAVVADLERTDPRLVVLRPGRVGRGRALNIGLSRVQSPLVAILDADDASHPERLRRQVEMLEAHPDASVLATNARVERTLTRSADWELPVGQGSVSVLDAQLLRTNPIIHSSVLMRTEDVRAIGGYDESRTAQLDYDLWLRFRASEKTLLLADLPLALHRRHPAEAFESMSPWTRAWSSYRLQISHFTDLPALRRGACHVVAAVRLAYQVLRSALWHARSRRQRMQRRG